MPTKPKLPKLLKALLALHGTCAAAAMFFVVWRTTYGDWPLRYIWLIFGSWDWLDWSYVGMSLAQLSGLLLPFLFIALLLLLRQRKKSASALLTAITFLELGALAGYLIMFISSPVMDSYYYLFMDMLIYTPGDFLLFIAIPFILFVGTFIYTWLSRNPIKAHLEAAK